MITVMKPFAFVICLCLSVSAVSQQNSIRPILLDGDSGVFFPIHYFELLEGKLIFKDFAVKEVMTFSGQVRLLEKDKQDLGEALKLRSEQLEIASRMSKAYETSYNSEKKAHEETTKDLKKAKNNTTLWQIATGVVAAVGTTLYIVK